MFLKRDYNFLFNNHHAMNGVAIIKSSLDKAGFEALRVDEFEGVYNINQKIIELIFTSDAIVADLTDWRPNVFYELGAAHAIDNKTVMIIQTKNDVPFDVGAYRCIRYEQTEAGLAKLSTSLVTSLRSLEAWRKNPTNPVQQFKPHGTIIPKSEMGAVQRELQNKDAQLIALQKNWEKAQRELQQAKEQNVSCQSAVEALQKKLKTALAKKTALANELKRLRAPVAPPANKPLLRSQPMDKLSGGKVKKMLKAHNFFCAEHDWNKEWSNPRGKGIAHKFELQHDGKVVVDHVTGLMWQQSGSPDSMIFADAQKFIAKFNAEGWAGYHDWRLPTREEAMSLMEPEKKNGNLYIAPEFDRIQQWIWTADMESAGVAWVAYFGNGLCGYYGVAYYNLYYVRAVRVGQSII